MKINEKTTFTKPLKDADIPNYQKWATWCNENGYVILDKEDHYECEKYVAPEPTIQQKIDALEAQQTPRMLRGAALGNEDDIAALEKIETEIQQLRDQLKG